MNILPDNQNNQQTQQAVSTPSTTISQTGAKEVEPGGIAPQEGLRDATGQEVSLPKEVISQGVRIQPTSAPIPPSVAQMGVKPAGANIPAPTTTTVALPITDDQISRGLHFGISNSLYWLAQWCIRRLKQVHIALKNVHGKLIRTKS